MPLRRKLDRSVIEYLHQMRLSDPDQKNNIPFDSVRAVFVEGGRAYTGAGFNNKNHIQICIRNPNCIKGFFHPREIDINFPKV